MRGCEDEKGGMRAGKKHQEELVDCKVTWNLTLYVLLVSAMLYVWQNAWIAEADKPVT